MNEAKLLAQVQATNFVSVNDAARLELAAKVQQALQQVRCCLACLAIMTGASRRCQDWCS